MEIDFQGSNPKRIWSLYARLQMKIAYFFTTFPVLSETFLQREIRSMRHLPVDIEIYSLWRGEPEFEGLPVKLFPKWKLIMLLWKLPVWCFLKPKTITSLLRLLARNKPPSTINLAETLIGIAFAIIHADQFNRNKPDLFHAVWATTPATAAMLLRDLTGIPYTMGSHAYDVFRDGGDWLLPQKLRTARLIHTTTDACRKALREKGAPEEKIVLVRRGLSVLPAFPEINKHEDPLRILSVGRLIEKKGYHEQLYIYRALKDAKIPFHARIAGKGSLLKELQKLRYELDLEDEVLFLGKLDFNNVAEQYQWADLFFFTGKVAANGDRDGLPNVIPEAMANGLPILTTDVAGTTEAIKHKHTGFVLPIDSPQAWVEQIKELQQDEQLLQRIRTNARKWVEDEFDSRKNGAKLAQHLSDAAKAHPLMRNPWLSQLFR